MKYFTLEGTEAGALPERPHWRSVPVYVRASEHFITLRAGGWGNEHGDLIISRLQWAELTRQLVLQDGPHFTYMGERITRE